VEPPLNDSRGVHDPPTTSGHYGLVARPPSRSTVAEAAEALRRLLAAIDAGEIDADDPKARALRRQLEGAATAWEVASAGLAGFESEIALREFDAGRLNTTWQPPKD
jgi:hypothetical protein